MTVDPARLLQMLEPAVRPGSASPTSGTKQGTPAFENRAFEDLLQEAKTSQTDVATEQQLDQTNPLDALAGLGQVENAGLREVLAKAHGLESGLGKQD